MSIVDVKGLWKASLLVGFSYGSAFGLFPAIIIEWFGMGTSQGMLLVLVLNPSVLPGSPLFRELGFSFLLTPDRREHFLHGVREEPRWTRFGRLETSTNDVP